MTTQIQDPEAAADADQLKAAITQCDRKIRALESGVVYAAHNIDYNLIDMIDKFVLNGYGEQAAWDAVKEILLSDIAAYKDALYPHDGTIMGWR